MSRPELTRLATIKINMRLRFHPERTLIGPYPDLNLSCNDRPKSAYSDQSEIDTGQGHLDQTEPNEIPIPPVRQFGVAICEACVIPQTPT